MTQADGEDSPWTPPARAHAWLWTTALLTAAALACAVVLAPPAGAPPVPALTWLLFTGSSVHVASTGWLFTMPAVRAYAREHVVRCVWAPVGRFVSAHLPYLVPAAAPAPTAPWRRQRPRRRRQPRTGPT